VNGAAKTAPSGGRVPPVVRGFEALVEDIRALRYMPLPDYERACVHLAIRIANAEGVAWDMHRARHIVDDAYDRQGTPGKACTACNSAWPASEIETDSHHERGCPCRPGAGAGR
jgi:hypothetical protein